MSILLDETTRVMVQGITGGVARSHVRYMLDYGTNIVCGVSPGKGGESVEEIPVYDTVAAALCEHAVDLSVLFIGARHVKDAALEAVANRIPLTFILEDGVPLHDTAEIVGRASDCGVRIVGPSAQGMISPGKAKIGGTGGSEPDRVFTPGPVGVISRSGGMGVEISLLLTRHGIGQSSYIAIGGDFIGGTGFADLLPLFEGDPETRAIVIFGETGTTHEEDAAHLIASGVITKPVIAFVAGTSLEHLPDGLTFGHTSAIMGSGEGSASAKKAALRAAGVQVAERFGDLLNMVSQALDPVRANVPVGQLKTTGEESLL
jgi:succinyl-CoA synthetase alpha subunit